MGTWSTFFSFCGTFQFEAKTVGYFLVCAKFFFFFFLFFFGLVFLLSTIPPIKCIRMHVATRTNERFWFTTFFLWPSSTLPIWGTVNWVYIFSGDDDVSDGNLVWICRWICPGYCSKSCSAFSSRYAKIMDLFGQNRG